MLLRAAERHQIHLNVLVAETSLWAHPEVHKRILRESGGATMFPNVRRARTAKGEKRGQVINGIRLDDNSYANMAIKRAVGLGRDGVEGFETCHIWPRTCYDERFHTAIANLVLLPRALAGLSDHDLEIQSSLQYRAYELYSWYPDGVDAPKKPEFYPLEWRGPELPTSITSSYLIRTGHTEANESGETSAVRGTSSAGRRIDARVRDWASKPHLNVHRIIGIVVRRGSMSRQQLAEEIERVTNSKNGYGAIGSLLRNRGNAYGRVFVDLNGTIRLDPAIEEQVLSFQWS
jgi:hypothetical protein